MSDQATGLKVLRWITLLPASLIGGYVGWFVVSLLNKITAAGYYNPNSFLGRLFIESVSHMAMGAAAIYIAARIAPVYKKQVSLIMCGLVILMAGLFLFPAILKPDYWAMYAVVCLVIGSGGMAYSVFSGETDIGSAE